MTQLKTLGHKLNAWLSYRSAVRSLSNLSDRELQDIGIGRGDIRRVAVEAAA
jgi:uncharacterized protein YjiS (DUF1127 family)